MTVDQDVSVREAARLTGRSEETIRRWIWSGKLPATKSGNHYRIDMAHLEQIAEIQLTAEAGHGSADGWPSGRLSAWLDDVDRWKRGLAGAGTSTAADLIIGDRRARR